MISIVYIIAFFSISALGQNPPCYRKFSAFIVGTLNSNVTSHIQNLKRIGNPGTFFITPKFVEEEKQYLRDIKNANYTIGLNLDSPSTYSSKQQTETDYSKASEWVYSAAGVWPKLVIVPFRYQTDEFKQYLSDKSYVLLPTHSDLTRKCDNPSLFNYGTFFINLPYSKPSTWKIYKYSIECSDEGIYDTYTGNDWVTPEQCLNITSYKETPPIFIASSASRLSLF